MRLVPILFPSDLGRSARGAYTRGGERGAPDVFLDMLEAEGIRLARPVAVKVPEPEEASPEDSRVPFDAHIASAVEALAEAVREVNAEANFPLVLGGDQLATCGHVLGHSLRHEEGIGLAMLADAHLDLVSDAPPVFEDGARVQKDPEVAPGGAVHQMTLAAGLRMLSEDSAFGRAMKQSALMAEQTSVIGVRGDEPALVKANEKKAGIEVWRMERLELDGESSYRSMLTRHLSAGPIVLSIDVQGLDPDLMSAVREPIPDGLDWSFLKRTLEQSIPHVDRVLGLDICELEPYKDDAHNGAMTRLAETLAPFLRRLTR